MASTFSKKNFVMRILPSNGSNGNEAAISSAPGGQTRGASFSSCKGLECGLGASAQESSALLPPKQELQQPSPNNPTPTSTNRSSLTKSSTDAMARVVKERFLLPWPSCLPPESS